ncbi:hypothetical protein [Nostoc sp. UHCC 0870]|uniref:hypothetical protein n=1 Tax=Nostoc sp. UHCC 0870 TaxID=2914041 RepID=UPI001EDDA721|nr:hypothetical protein [Nostoc sp. UHCC 0870]UKO97059.1 hypothetical protein L6494_21055 [Nostoc sp. UHCC 0870]
MPQLGVRGRIIKSGNDIKAAKIPGDMYYLDASDNKWWRAKISFYRSGSQEAKSIDKDVVESASEQTGDHR